MSVREHWINVRVNPEELARIREKQKELGIRNTGAYMRKMAMDGYCVNLDLSDVVQVSTLLRRCSNNLNQYAKRANESGSIYAEDIRDLQKRLDELWEMQKLILKRLSGISSRITARLTLSLAPASVRSTGCLTAASRTALRHWFTCTDTRRIPSATCVSTTCTRCSVYMNPRSTGCRI